MTNPECKFSPTKQEQAGSLDLLRACKVGACSINGMDVLRSATAHGDASIMDAIRAKAAPDCVINEPPQPMPPEAQPPAEQ